MTDQNGPAITHAENENFEDETYDELLDEEEWEDQQAKARVEERLGKGWYVAKIHRYNSVLFAKIDDWLSSNCRGEYRKEGWTSGCSYTVALCFRDSSDAVFYRLRWGDVE